MTLMPFVMLGLSVMVVSAFRTKHEDQPYPPMSLSELGGDFVCPDECLECCQAHATGFFRFGWLGRRTDERYKCVLKNSSKLPPGCNGAKAQTHERTYMGRSQYKVTCPFGDGLKGDKAEARRKQLPSQCSKRMDCCCDMNHKPWLQCFGVSVKAKNFQQVSDKTGSKEFFVLEAQTKMNNGSCVNPSLKEKALEYQTHVSKMEVSKLGTHGRCCLRIGKTSKSVRTGTRYTSQRTAAGPIKRVSHPIHKTVSWTACKEFEALYLCTEDKGITQSGSLYKGIPIGQCLGQTSDSGPTLKVNDYGVLGCPNTHFTKDCMCEEEC